METVQETTVTEKDISLNELLGMPGGESVLLPEEKKPNLFSAPTENLEFLDISVEKKDPKLDAEGKPIPVVKTGAEIIDELTTQLTPEQETEKIEKEKTAGRPKVDKDGLIEFTNKLIEKKLIVPFDDEKKLEDYTISDFEELFETNAAERDRKVREETPLEFFDSLPQEMQYAAKYIADGGKDLKGLFKTLSQVEEVKSLDPKEERDQEQIVRNYLTATRFGTPEDIQEEIDSWKDKGELDKKAEKFKPKLEALQEEYVTATLQQQEEVKKKQQAQAQKYMENVYDVLAPGELNGLKLDKKTQGMLYTGLVQPNYPSISGRSTNLLGHLLEKYQFVEPNHQLVAEALWLLADPDGYKERVRTVTKKEVQTETVRKLKTAQSEKIATHSETETPTTDNKRVQEKLQRPNPNFFKRP